MTRRLIFASALLFAIAANAAADSLDEAFSKDVLIIEASAHACHRFDVYLAISNPQRARGLMHVRQLPPDTGMLFIYEHADYLSMYMKNTYISLDMIFARLDGSISSVARYTEPMSLRSIVATEPVSFVLELNAGTTERLFIDENSRLVLETVGSSDQ
jgi:uncharacterized membrane protein (UPF0127 family)